LGSVMVSQDTGARRGLCVSAAATQPYVAAAALLASFASYPPHPGLAAFSAFSVFAAFPSKWKCLTDLKWEGGKAEGRIVQPNPGCASMSLASSLAGYVLHGSDLGR
jgi:hypothetical protein